MKFLTSFLFLAIGCAATYAQERIVDEATYNEQMRKASEYRLKENYRVSRITEFCEKENCIWKPVSSDVMEYDHPGKRRSFMIDTGRGETKPSTEWIFIDNKIYVKRPNMDWRIEEQKIRDGNDQTSQTIKIEYKDLGAEIKGLDEMRVLLRTAHWRVTLNGEESENIQAIKAWIDQTGRLKKQEYLLTDSRRGSTKLTMFYEVDPSIKVEAPIK
ncbi:MAG TPA: hypothetical protein VK468_07600 [Pyrinomonadaceae bacterium]|nr:hypothetical protein [Pyrinomonadaceae bacterium]